MMDTHHTEPDHDGESMPEQDTNKYSWLSGPPYPQFSVATGAHLPAASAESLCRTAMGITSVVRILHRSALLREDVEAFGSATEHPLSPFDEDNLWSALTVLSENFNSIVGDMLKRAQVDTAS